MRATPDATDVLVVGGGPAGLAAAATTAAAGLETLVVERRDEIGDPVHTSGATALDTVLRFGIPASLYHPVRRVRVLGPESETVLAYEQPPLCVLDVRGTYRFLADRARAAGAVVETGVLARQPLLAGGAVAGCRLVSARGSEHRRARVVIDASGYRASIARRSGLHSGFKRFGVGAEVELEAPGYPQDEALLLVGSRYAPAGYGWAFPWGGARVRIGVGVHHADVRADPERLLRALLEDASSLGLRLAGTTETERHFGLVPAERLPARLVADGLVAVGDAACQATLVVGEGIRIALDAGSLAGCAVAGALARGRTDRRALLPYERAFRRAYARKLALGYAANRRLARYTDADWDEHVRLLRRLPLNLVPELLQSEFSLRMVVRLLAAPPVWPSALRLASGLFGRTTQGHSP